MKLIIKYTAIQISSRKVNDNIEVVLEYGRTEGPYYSIEHPREEFDSEEEAMEYAYKKNKYANWLIVPIVRFDNF